MMQTRTETVWTTDMGRPLLKRKGPDLFHVETANFTRDQLCELRFAIDAALDESAGEAEQAILDGIAEDRASRGELTGMSAVCAMKV